MVCRPPSAEARSKDRPIGLVDFHGGTWAVAFGEQPVLYDTTGGEVDGVDMIHIFVGRVSEFAIRAQTEADDLAERGREVDSAHDLSGFCIGPSDGLFIE